MTPLPQTAVVACYRPQYALRRDWLFASLSTIYGTVLAYVTHVQRERDYSLSSALGAKG